LDAILASPLQKYQNTVTLVANLNLFTVGGPMKFSRLSNAFVFSIIVTVVGTLHAEEAAKAPAPIAKIGNTVLTEDELRKDMGMNLYQVEQQLYMTKKNWVDQKAKTIVFDQAAKAAGLSLQAWQAREIDGKTTPPTQQEIDQWAPRFGVQGSTVPPSDAQYKAMKEQATQYLTQQKRTQRENDLHQQLSQKSPIELFFTKPEAPHIDVTYTKDSPVKGPKDAPITVMEFTDFQCPWCKRSQDSVKATEQVYGDKIKLVDRMFPLTSMHPRAMPSAEAAFCAKEQGKYWEFRDKLFPSETMSDSDFKQFAKDIGLNQKKFDTCLTTHKYAAQVQADIADGQRFGVQGTPTFFVNGIQTGFPQLQETVKSELDKKKS
jgi:protein-disulfide isomerase